MNLFANYQWIINQRSPNRLTNARYASFLPGIPKNGCPRLLQFTLLAEDLLVNRFN